MSKINKIILLGGDDRQYYMALKLKELNFPVAVYGLDMKDKKGTIYEATSMKDALSFGNLILCSVPCSKNNINLYSKGHYNQLIIKDLLNGLTDQHKLFGGAICPCIIEHCNKHHIPYYDFMKMESVAVLNSIATAEGAIAEAILQSPYTLHQSQCMVLGFGRCGKILADKLCGLKSHVTIAARKEDVLCLAKSYGYETIALSQLKTILPQASFIFNTIPEMILDATNLSYVKKGATIIDISSTPGGVDFEYCEQMKINAALCLGLPGKYAPQTSADILIDAFLSVLNQPTFS